MASKQSHDKSWSSYYENHKFSYSNIALHMPYLLKIFSLMPRRILEIGCGPADHSFFIKKINFLTKIFLIDSDEGIVDKVKKESKGQFEQIYLCDILDNNKLDKLKMPLVDVVISQGLLEHFEDDEFIDVIENFRGRAKNFVCSVPSNYYPVIEYGNEKLRSKKEIEKLLSKMNQAKIKVTSYLDMGIRTKLIWLKMNKCSFSQKLKYLLFCSNHLLVSIKYLDKK